MSSLSPTQEDKEVTLPRRHILTSKSVNGKVKAAMAEALGERPSAQPTPPPHGKSPRLAAEERSNENRSKTRVNISAVLQLLASKEMLNLMLVVSSRLKSHGNM